MKEIVIGLIRHAATFGGGLGISAGVTSHDEITTAVSAIVTLAGIVWSIIEKVRAKRS